MNEALRIEMDGSIRIMTDCARIITETQDIDVFIRRNKLMTITIFDFINRFGKLISPENAKIEINNKSYTLLEYVNFSKQFQDDTICSMSKEYIDKKLPAIVKSKSSETKYNKAQKLLEKLYKWSDSMSNKHLMDDNILRVKNAISITINASNAIVHN